MKVKFLILVCTVSFLVACASALPGADSVVMEVDTSNTSSSSTYGYSEKNPILLGGFMLGTEYEGFHYKYFQSLVGPKGQQVKAKRLGSCCGFVDSSQPFGGSGLLDKYELTYEGQKEPVVIYVNLYKHEAPQAPSGFGIL